MGPGAFLELRVPASTPLPGRPRVSSEMEPSGVSLGVVYFIVMPFGLAMRPGYETCRY